MKIAVMRTVVVGALEIVARNAVRVRDAIRDTALLVIPVAGINEIMTEDYCCLKSEHLVL